MFKKLQISDTKHICETSYTYQEVHKKSNYCPISIQEGYGSLLGISMPHDRQEFLTVRKEAFRTYTA